MKCLTKSKINRRFFYLIPEQTRARLDGESVWQYIKRLLFRGRHQLPSGGVRVIYQHCEILKKHGFKAYPVHLGNFSVDWFSHSLKELTKEQALEMISTEDVVICPEIIPTVITWFSCRHRICFVQNWALINIGTKGKKYEDFGFTGILSCSGYITRFMKEQTALPIATVVNGIDLNLFYDNPELREPDSVLYLNRRNVSDARRAISMLPADLRQKIHFIELENKYPQEKLAEIYRQADIFLAIGYPEGFSLPPLEAMASGCSVAGFTGGGGLEHMHHNETALVATDGSVEELASCLLQLLTDKDLKERLRQKGLETARNFSLEHLEKSLVSFAKDLD